MNPKTESKKIDKEIEKNIEQAEEKQVSVSPNQIVLATYLSIFVKTVDDIVKEGGHSPIMEKVPTSKLMDVFSLFGNVNSIREVYKGFKKICPEAMPSADITKKLYLRYPFIRGMCIAKIYFGNTETINTHISKSRTYNSTKRKVKQ